MKKLVILTTIVLLCSLSVFGQLQVKSTGEVHIGAKAQNFKLLLGQEYYIWTTVTTQQRIPAVWQIESNSVNGSLHIRQPYLNNNQAVTGIHISARDFLNNVKLGIGREPLYSLDVNGQIRAGSQILNSSDLRFKTEINEISHTQSSKIYNLTPKSYFKTNYDTTLREEKRTTSEEKENIFEYGFIAQELIDVFPELVFEDKEGYYSINYIGLIPMIVDVLKEQKKQMDEQAQLINELLHLLSNEDLKKIQIKSENQDNSLNLQTDVKLKQNTPNPFNTETLIEFYIPEYIAQANIYIFDMNGKQMKNIEISNRGNGNIIIRGNEFRAAMYIYTLIADGKEIDTKRMILTE